MQSTEKLIEESHDPRLQKLPLYARELIGRLARRLQTDAASAQWTKVRAEKEVDEIRTLLADGPEGSDTFVEMPRTMLSTLDEDGQRPLGTGVSVEFRPQGAGPGEGFEVRLESGSLVISGVNRIAVIPRDSHSVTIEAR